MRTLILAAIFSLFTSSQTFAASFDGQQFVELNHGGYHDGYQGGRHGERYEHGRQGEHYDGDGCYEDGYGHRGEGRHRGGYRE